MNNKTNTQQLIKLAKQHGVSDVQLISAESIMVEDRFRLHCEKPKCPGFGQALSCPPHSMTPSEFRELLKTYQTALVFKYDFPIGIFETDERDDAAKLIHETSAALEQHAKTLGFVKAKSFAGGSCKLIFCKEFADCQALGETGVCRFPDLAKVSMSGLGVNFHELSKLLGWQMMKDEHGAEIKSETAMMAGLVLIF